MRTMTRAGRSVLLGGLLVLLGSEPAAAQDGAAVGTWWDWALPVVAGREEVVTARGLVILPVPGGDQRVGELRGEGAGPPFCRNGQGHPVHGWRWCVEKGFDRTGPRWEQTRWDEIILRHPQAVTAGGTLGRGTLIDILGAVVLGRIESLGRGNADRSAVTGRWIAAPELGGNVLQIQVGGIPLAELSDLDGDGRVDAILVNAER